MAYLFFTDFIFTDFQAAFSTVQKFIRCHQSIESPNHLNWPKREPLGAMSVDINITKYYQNVKQSEYSQLSTSEPTSDVKRPIVDKKFGMIAVSVCAALLLISGAVFALKRPLESAKEIPVMGSAWSSKAEPFSYVDPTTLGILSIDRPASSKPGRILDNLISVDPESRIPDTPLPTNTWYQNLILGDSNIDPENKIFQIPHIIDTAGYIRGIRTHPCHMQANDRMVMVSCSLFGGSAADGHVL